MDNEFAMQYKNTAAAANIVGRRSMIRTLLLFLIQKAIANPITEFHRVHKVNDESKRIAVAIIVAVAVAVAVASLLPPPQSRRLAEEAALPPTMMLSSSPHFVLFEEKR